MREELKKAIEVLKSGGTILYPTDTIWGIGCDATNNKAVQKIYRIKQRKFAKSLIILLDQEEKLTKYVKKVPDTAWDLLSNIDTPLTIIYPNAKNLAKNVIASDKTIAIRIVKNDFCKKLINLFNKPIVSTSANMSDEPIPLTFNNISPEIKSNVDHIVDLHKNNIHQIKPSTIIKLEEDGEFIVIRT